MQKTADHNNDWIPTLESAACWNSWTEDELLMQLASHLKGRALYIQWKLLGSKYKNTHYTAIKASREYSTEVLDF